MENVPNAENLPDLSLLSEDFANDVSNVVRVKLSEQKPTAWKGDAPMYPHPALIEAEFQADRRAYENYQKFMDEVLLRRDLKSEYKGVIVFGTGGDWPNKTSMMDWLYPKPSDEMVAAWMSLTAQNNLPHSIEERRLMTMEEIQEMYTSGIDPIKSSQSDPQNEQPKNESTQSSEEST